MSKLVAMGLAAVVVVASAVGQAAAFGCRHGGCDSGCATPSCGTQVTYVDKEITCYRTEWKTRDVQCVVNKMVPKEVTSEYTCTVMVPEWKEEKRNITVCKMVPKVVEREVTCCKMVPVTCTDPCTGCTYTCCKPQTFTQKVQCTVCEMVKENKEITVKVCVCKPEKRTYKCTRIVCECKQETVTCKQCYCVSVPYKTTVKVAVCTPCATPCCK